MKTALIIRHVPREGVAGFRAPIEAAGYVIDRVDVDNQDFHALDFVAPDLVVMMGGPMGVYEREAHPWISCQLTLLARRLAADRPTLGVCFGSQMIAAALGADVYPGPTKEIGFAPVTMGALWRGEPTPLVRAAIEEGRAAEVIQQAALESGMISIRERCLELLRSGITSFDEFARLRL